MKLNQKQTIYDIARAAGASPTTVSAALNGTWKARRIRADTVDRIKKIAAELGYSANLQARGLRKAKSGLVGMIIPQHDNRFFSSLSQAFTEGARDRGELPRYHFDTKESGSGSRSHSQPDRLCRGRPDGCRRQ